jgi:D-beta-D-heptose 7-phosphate kinase/D-beta-D-heptose 1-phosphate adenosyltransferase
MKGARTSKKVRVVAVSGGFDPIHIGHVRYIQEARKLGDRLVVILNNDAWLMNKKGFAFMPEAERKEVVGAIAGVDEVVLTDHALGEKDRSVCRALRAVRPQVFANGGDRKPDGDPVPEVAVCDELGIEMAYNLGVGGKVQSSSWLTARAAKQKKRSATRNASRKLRRKTRSV